MRTSLAVLLALAAGMTAVAAPAATRPSDISWGKPGVPLDEYRRDAAECVTAAVNLDISGAEPTRILTYVSRALQTADNAWGVTIGHPSIWAGYPGLVEMARVERQFERIAEMQQAALDVCLFERGYRPFRLTDEQRRQMHRLDEGSAERQVYLHGLASQRAVLDRQAVELPAWRFPQG